MALGLEKKTRHFYVFNIKNEKTASWPYQWLMATLTSVKKNTDRLGGGGRKQVILAILGHRSAFEIKRLKFGQ